MHRLATPGLALLAIALAFILSGCGTGTSATSPPLSRITQSDADDVALQAALNLDVLLGDKEAATASSGGVAPPSSATALRPAAVLWDTSFTRNGITYQASRTFYDLAGNPLPGWGPTAARLVWTSSASGTATTAQDTVTVGHSGLLMVTGLLAVQDTLRLNGTWGDTLSNVFHSYDGTTVRYFHWLSSVIGANVHELKTGGFPLSGTVTLTVSADRLRARNGNQVEAHLDATVVITFNGTAQPDVLVNGDYHYKWNMITNAMTRV